MLAWPWCRRRQWPFGAAKKKPRARTDALTLTRPEAASPECLARGFGLVPGALLRPQMMLPSCPLPASSTQSPGSASEIARSQRVLTLRPRVQVGVVDPTGVPRTRHDLGDDRVGVLEARILCGHDHDVGQLGGYCALTRPLLPVALPGAAEDGDEVPPWVKGSQETKNLLSESGVWA